MGSFGNNKSPWEKAAKQSSKQSPANKQPSAPPLPNPKIKSPGEETLEEVLGEMSRAMLESPDVLPDSFLDGLTEKLKGVEAPPADQEATADTADQVDPIQQFERDQRAQEEKEDRLGLAEARRDEAKQRGISIGELAAEENESADILFGRKRDMTPRERREAAEQRKADREAQQEADQEPTPQAPDEAAEDDGKEAGSTPEWAGALVELLTVIATDLSEIKDLMSSSGEGGYHG